MKNNFLILTVFSISAILISCDGGPKINGGKPAATVNASKNKLAIDNGRVYFETNCSGCHSAGKDDLTVAFNASDLKLSTKITNDMSNATIYGGQFDLMKRFSAVPAKRIDDLKSYLNSVKKN